MVVLGGGVGVVSGDGCWSWLVVLLVGVGVRRKCAVLPGTKVAEAPVVVHLVFMQKVVVHAGRWRFPPPSTNSKCMRSWLLWLWLLWSWLPWLPVSGSVGSGGFLL